MIISLSIYFDTDFEKLSPFLSGDLRFLNWSWSFLNIAPRFNPWMESYLILLFDAQFVTTVNELIPFVHCFSLEDMRGSRPEGQVCSTVRSNRLASNSTQKYTSNDYCPCRRTILCVEDLPGDRSPSHL
ncbi:hypothetical protein TNCV_3402681 [Trichonephila clavipes]|nr:hypothetical protein TNCV_3402681 [Trichonephila clavipes]